jgi:integrase
LETYKSQIKDVDWETPTLQRWMNGIRNTSTKYTYRTAFRAYAQFTGLTADQMIDEAVEDDRLDPRERKDVVLTRLINFHEWLTTEYKVKSRGTGKHEVVSKGTTDRAAVMRVNVIRSFYSTFGINVKMTGRHKLKKGKVKNKRMIVSAEQVKTLVDHARNVRDKAIILVNFQGGLDASTLCTLNYEDVAEAIETGKEPFKLNLVRPKTDQEYYTFIGKDAINALKVYVADQRARGVEWTPESPLFTKERRGTDERITPNLIQNMMKELAQLAGFVDHKNNGKDFNILGPHALRESFSTIMLNANVPKPIVDFWLGHSIGATDEAYMNVQAKSAKQIYLKNEHLISIDTASEDRSRLAQIESSVSDLAAEKGKLKARLQKVEAESQKFAIQMLKRHEQLLNLVNKMAEKPEVRAMIQEAQAELRDEEYRKAREDEKREGD